MAKSYKLHDKLDDLTLYLLTNRQGYVNILLDYMNFRNMSIIRTLIFAKIYSSTQSRLPFNDSLSTSFCWWLRRRLRFIITIRLWFLEQMFYKKLSWDGEYGAGQIILHPRGKKTLPHFVTYAWILFLKNITPYSIKNKKMTPLLDEKKS